MMEEFIDLLYPNEKEQELSDKTNDGAGEATLIDDGGHATVATDGETDSHQEIEPHVDVGNHKRGRPKKKQRTSLVKQEATRDGERSEERDLLASGLKQLKKTRDEIEDYGLQEYFPESIKRMEDLLGR